MAHTTSPWGIFIAIVGRRTGDRSGWTKGKPSAEPVDRDLPLGLHIDGKITLAQAEFLLAKAGGAKTKSPGKDLIVRAWGSVKYKGFTIHTFYLTPDGNDDEQSMLRIVTDEEGAIAECRLFRTYAVVTPQTQEEWALWLANPEGMIGFEQFKDQQETLYDRVWESGGSTYIEPYKFVETVVADRQGADRYQLTLSSMLYGRELKAAGGGQDAICEYMLVECVEDHTSAQVHIKVGLDINPRSITVVY